MNEVNKTLFIPLYGKALVSKKRIIITDKKAEQIWEKEAFPIKGKSKSKWLAYYMAMRARIFDDWTDKMLQQCPDSLILHIGCGLDSRHERVDGSYAEWIDADFMDVISVRKKYFQESSIYHMIGMDVSETDEINSLPPANCVIVILEGISMYLQNSELKRLLETIQEKYPEVHILMDVYTEFAAKASKYKNPVNDVGVTELYGVDDVECLVADNRLNVKAEHSLTPDYLVDELEGFEKSFFRVMFTGSLARKIYRLYEFETAK